MLKGELLRMLYATLMVKLSVSKTREERERPEAEREESTFWIWGNFIMVLEVRTIRPRKMLRARVNWWC